METDETGETLSARVEILDFYFDPIIASGTVEMKKKPLVPKAVLFDDFFYTYPNNNYLQVEFQNFLNDFNKNPMARGYVFIQAKNSKNAKRIEKVIEDYGKNDDFDTSRIIVKRGTKDKKNAVRFYIAPMGAKVPLS